MRVADRRSRSTFWLDDAFIDRCGPWLGRFPCGTVAIAVYVALARHADRSAEAYPKLSSLARWVGSSRSGVQRALRLLELGGLIAVLESYDVETDKQLSNTYVLLTPPEDFPELSVKWDEWPDPERRRVQIVIGGDGRRQILDGRENKNTRSGGSTGDTGEGLQVTPPLPTGDTHRARDLLSEGKPIEGQGGRSPDGLTSFERWERLQERERKNRGER